jgi:hypothetical protein
MASIDANASFIQTANEVFRKLGAYPSKPKVPVLPLTTALTLWAQLEKAAVPAKEIARSVAGDADSRFATATRRFKSAAKSIVQSAQVDAMNEAKRIAPDAFQIPMIFANQTAPKTILTPDQAEKFWAESGKFAAEIQAVVDNPYLTTSGMMFLESVGIAILELPAVIAVAVEKTVQFAAELAARLAVAITKGAATGVAAGFGTYFTVAIFVLVGGYFIWRFYPKLQRSEA